MKQENIDLLNRQEERMKEHLMWVAKEGIKNLFDSYKQINVFINQTLILSAGISGVVIPFLIEKDQTKLDLIYLSLTLFVLNIIIGVVNMSTFVTNLPDAMNNISQRQENRILNFINEIQNIKLIEDNNKAGMKYEELTKKIIPNDTEFQITGSLMKRLMGFEVWFFGLFISGLLSLFISILML